MYSLKNVDYSFECRSKDARYHLGMLRNHPKIRKLSLKTLFRGSSNEEEDGKLGEVFVKFNNYAI